jgi:hypothetical protein
MSRQYKDLITHGIESPLHNIKFHGDAPLKRILMSGLEAGASYDMHIAVHEISENLPFEHRHYSSPHAHNCREWNLILGKELIFEITLNDEVYHVEAPATIFIPEGVIHSANVLKGCGYFVAIVDTLDYDNSFLTSLI